MESVLDPNKKKNNKNSNTPINIVLTAEKEKKFKKLKLQSFLLNKRKIHHIQNNWGKFVLKLTIEREAEIGLF